MGWDFEHVISGWSVRFNSLEKRIDGRAGWVDLTNLVIIKNKKKISLLWNLKIKKGICTVFFLK
jgi:hypothetical protein